MFIPRTFTSALVLWATLGLASTASAQRAFLDIPEIPGDSVVEGFEGSIDVMSIRQNTAGTAKKSAACDVSVVKGLDSAGPALWATAASGLTLSEMVIVVLRNSPDTVVKLYEIRLSNVRIGSVQSTVGATDSSETVTLLPQGVDDYLLHAAAQWHTGHSRFHRVSPASRKRGAQRCRRWRARVRAALLQGNLRRGPRTGRLAVN